MNNSTELMSGEYLYGETDTEIGIYRDADDGPCEVCMLQEETWEDRVVDEMLVYNSKFQVETSL